MSEFKIYAIYCLCMDKKCKSKATELGETYDSHAGHIEKVDTVFRTWKPTCLGMFTNNDPDRMLLRWGMDPNNANSKQDCKNARYVIAKTARYSTCCVRCTLFCDWKGSPAASEAGSAAGDEDLERPAVGDEENKDTECSTGGDENPKCSTAEGGDPERSTARYEHL